MVARRQTLDMWIAEAMTDDEKGQIASFVLVYTQKMGGEEIDSVRFTGSKSWKASELALRFKGKAESFCQDRPGSHEFQLQAYYANEVDGEMRPSTEPGARHPFTVMGADGVTSGSYVDQVTGTGALGQSMRHVEVMFIEQTKMSRILFERTVDLNQQLILQNAATQKELNESYKVIRDMYLQARGEEHKMQLEERKADRDGMLIEALLKYAPALLNTISGRDIFPQSTADTALIEGIVRTLKPEHIEVLSNIIPPESFGLLMARFEQVLDKRTAAEDSARKAAALTPGAEDAAGELTDGK